MSSHSPHWKVKSSLWALPVSKGGVYCKIHLLSFLYIFLLVDCFKWALIDRIEKQRVHSELCQFQTCGGGISYDSPGVISLYIPISRLFQMSSHWLHWKAKSSLWALPVSNWGGGGGGVYCMIHLVSFLYIFLLVDCFKCQRVHSVLWQF